MIRVMVSFLPMAVCAFWSVALALNIWGKGNRAAHSWLLLWSVTASLLYLGHFVFFNRITDVIPLSDTIYVVCNMLVYPLYLQYITVFTTGTITRKRQWLIVSPPAIIGTIVAVVYMMMSDEECRMFIDTYLYNNTFEGLTGLAMVQAVAHHISKGVFAVGVVWVLVVGISRIRKYNRLIDSIYADNDDKRLFGISTILLLLIITGMLSLSVNAIGRFALLNSTIPFALLACFFTSLLYMLCYFGFEQQFSFADIPQEERKVAPKGEHTMDLPCEKSLRLLQKIDDEQLYLQPGLTLVELAKQLGTNRTMLSKLVNEEAGMSFAEFINRKRIAYVKRLENENPEALKQDLAEKAGYTSMRSFYRNYNLYHNS